MGRPRGFDEEQVVRSAVALFAGRAFDGISVDDLVAHLGVHRNSLYKTFGSKRGLYLAALRWHLRHQVRPLLTAVTAAPEPARALREIVTGEHGADLDLLLLAAVERAPVDDEVAGEVTAALRELDRVAEFILGGADPDATPSDLAHGLGATILGLRVRARAGDASAGAGAAVLDRIHPRQD